MKGQEATNGEERNFASGLFFAQISLKIRKKKT